MTEQRYKLASRTYWPTGDSMLIGDCWLEALPIGEATDALHYLRMHDADAGWPCEYWLVPA